MEEVFRNVLRSDGSVFREAIYYPVPLFGFGQYIVSVLYIMQILIKPMDTNTPFHDHPFLISFLLGREYVKTQRICLCVLKNEHSALHESVMLKLARAVARYDDS